MQTLAEEWKKRDKERELLFQRKVDEYSKLEEKMKTVSFCILVSYDLKRFLVICTLEIVS